MKIGRIRKVALFSLASVLLQFGGYVYLFQNSNQGMPDFLVILGVNGAVSYLFLILVAVGNVLSGGFFGRLQEVFWETCLVGFFSLLGLGSIPVLMGIIRILRAPVT